MSYGTLVQSALRSAGRLVRQFVALFAMSLAIVAAPALAALDSKGTDFWLMFNANFNPPAMSLFITGDTATNGVVSIPGIGFSTPFPVVPGAVTTVVLPATAEVTAVDSITNQGIHVIANAEVTVYGLNRLQFSTDAYLGLPTDVLGTDYINLGYSNTNVLNATQFGIVGTQAGTVVTITPTAQAGARPAGVPYTITLNQGQTYQLRSTATAPADLSGTLITSTAPIAVFGGHQCANIPAGAVACDHIVEQLPPTTTWGRAFVTMPLASRTAGDTFRVLASTNGTVVTLNGANVATLNRGQFHERIITVPSRITTNNPVLVAQYSNGTSFDGITSDPFEMLVPPFEQFLASYTVTTPATGFAINYINLVVPNAAIGTVSIDGVPIPAAAFTAIAGTTFSGAQRSITVGTHNLVGAAPFGTFVYGFANADSYGYPGGQAFGEVARVATVTLTPLTATGPINTQHCVNAAVADQFSQAVPGVRVDFTVTGVNPNTGFATANSGGVAQFCYTGTAIGTDSIGGVVGTISGNTVTKIWAALVSSCDVNRDGQIDRNDLTLIQAAIGQTPTANDPRDANGDGKITVNDVRTCTLRCTRASCAVN